MGAKSKLMRPKAPRGEHPRGDAESERIDLENIAAEMRDGRDEINGQKAEILLSDEDDQSSQVYSDEDVLGLDLSDSDVEDPEDKAVYRRIKKTLSEKVLPVDGDEVDESEDDDEEEHDWGKSKQNYYHQSSSDELEEDEALAENAEEARRLQRLKEAELTGDDYFDDLVTGLDGSDVSEDSEISQTYGQPEGGSYEITDGFPLHMLPKLGVAPRPMKPADNQDSNAKGSVAPDFGLNLENNRHVLLKVQPFVEKLPYVIRSALELVGPKIYFCSKLRFLIGRSQYKIYKLLRNHYQTCLAYVNSVLFYVFAASDLTFPREKLREVSKSLSKLCKMLDVYQKVLGIPTLSAQYIQDLDEGIKFKVLQAEVKSFLSTGPTPRFHSDPAVVEGEQPGTTSNPVGEEEDETNSTAHSSSAECAIGPVGLVNRPKIIPMNDYDERSDMDSNEDPTEITSSFAQPVRHNFRHPSMESLVEVKRKRLKAQQKEPVCAELEKNMQPVQSSLDSDMQLYNEYKSAHKKERKVAKNRKKKSELENIQRLRSLYMKQHDISDGEKRFVSKEIIKNRGLTPNTKRERRNPRVKKRIKYEKSLIKLKSIRPVPYDKKSLGKYRGEVTGIKADISRSTRLS